MAEVNISAEVRTEFGKGAARRTRRANLVPAVVYGHGGDPVHVTLPAHQLMMALKTQNVLINLDVDGKSQLVIPKAVQRDAIRRFVKHIDLLIVRKGEKVTVDVAVKTEGELAPGSGLLEHLLNSLPVETEATQIPTEVIVSIEGLTPGDSILAKDVKLPSGTTLAIDPEAIVLQVVAPQVEAEATDEAGATA
ncbi:50S ribosomal protein L25/general stress protein Ctc [Streptomyces sp. H27-D2]|uniref:50S ribosomal protein L25/general stress protein Ctc n=1 Tax=Streptomyces sp. H27-D2 TaxID=3046304 RepID=UPI002DB9084B|nr:50S ribosomal protein L25/general stress protein Ctc [Streptomyces sp. H27-D2]MEC4020117.1 50S ribosomal protein L25/general stress protein Ctc [Streptomyces sp. H27-D2]